MAPELVNDPNRVSEKADVWSLGMVCAAAARSSSGCMLCVCMPHAPTVVQHGQHACFPIVSAACRELRRHRTACS